MKKIRVGILFGGRSGEHEVSITSAMSVYQALDKQKYDVTLIAIDKEGRWLLPDAKQLLAQAATPRQITLTDKTDAFGLVPYESKPQLVPVGSTRTAAIPHVDVILPILHGTYGEDGTVQGLLELAQIPYAGSGVLGSALGMDKDLSGRLFALAGIPTVPTLSVHAHEFEDDQSSVCRNILKDFKLPLFVKPANAGSSVGVHKVKRAEDLASALADAFLFDTKILVQKAIDAREVEVAVLGNARPRASVVGEIVPRHEFYSYEAKYIDDQGAELLIPARDLTPKQTEQIQAWAIKAFLALECRGMSRVDFFIDRQTQDIYINEINTIPGFTSISMYPKLWAASGIAYADLLDELIGLATENFTRRRRLKTSYEPVPETT